MIWSGIMTEVLEYKNRKIITLEILTLSTRKVVKS